MKMFPLSQQQAHLTDDAVPCMVLFTAKGEQMSKELIWETIMDRREVGVLGTGKMMGPALYRNALELLLLDRVFLEEYFGDRISLEATTKDYQLNVTVTNTYSHPVSGTLELVLAPELKMTGALTTQVAFLPTLQKHLQFALNPQASAMRKTNPIAVIINGELQKRALWQYWIFQGQFPSISFFMEILQR